MRSETREESAVGSGRAYRCVSDVSWYMNSPVMLIRATCTSWYSAFASSVIEGKLFHFTLSLRI